MKNEKTVVAFYGVRGSGKTSAAQYFFKHGGFVKMSFASTIRDMLRALAVPEEYLESGANKMTPIPELGGLTFREAAISLGTKWGREMVSDDIWADALIRRIQRSTDSRIVVDDLRFLNELNALKSIGATVIMVYRSSAIADASKAGLFTEPTEAEWMLLSADNVVCNDCSVGEYEQRLENMLEWVISRPKA